MIDSTRTATVDPDYYWRPMRTCPIGSKVQLLNKGGVAAYGKWGGKEDYWLGWAPLPTKPEWMKNGSE